MGAKLDKYNRPLSNLQSDQLIAGRGKLETKIKDLDTSIKALQQSGIAKLLTTKETN